MLVCLPVFKTGTDGEQPPGWVRFHMPPPKRSRPVGGFFGGACFMFLIFIFFWLELPECGILIPNRYTEERNHAMDTIYDVIILGAGPAGLSAAIYAGRGRLNTLLLEQGQDGGQIALTAHLDNYPGQLEGDSGSSLIARMSAQADRAGVQRIRDTIRTAELDGPVKKLAGRTEAYLAKTVILASGASPRPIGCKNEDAYVGRGISFCATCDAAFFGIWRSLWQAAGTLPWRKPCISPALPAASPSSIPRSVSPRRRSCRSRPLKTPSSASCPILLWRRLAAKATTCWTAW